ncbi:MAG: hypothetical protein WAN51_00845 [Alphaproteobacteria bacterium]
MAEDDADDRMMVKEAFEERHLGNELHFVEDGEQLQDYLHHRGKFVELMAKPYPALILLDLNMPKKDGREAVASKNFIQSGLGTSFKQLIWNQLRAKFSH